jgi:hypothetical protein
VSPGKVPECLEPSRSVSVRDDKKHRVVSYDR